MEQIAFSLRELLDQVCKIVQRQADEKNLALHCRVSEALYDSLIGDAAHLREVLLNLIGNAVKFTPSGLVEVCVTPESWDETSGKAGLHFSIRDTGIGIPENQLQVIFDAVGQLVKPIGGRLWVESIPSVGSTFHFTCLMEIGVSPKAMRSSEEDEPDSPLRILLAEDNVISRHLATALLEKRNHQVKVVGTGLEAVQAWETEKFDVILMDHEMPEMSGIDAANRIRVLERERGLARRTPMSR